jgi:antirestriction protein ArdC
MAGERFSSHAWLTYKQAEGLGGHVRKGERGTMVVYADKFIPKAKEGEAEKKHPVFFLKAFTVFNVAQCDDLPEQPAKVAPSMPEIHAEADRVIRDTGARIILGGDRAFYMPATDSITMPVPAAYEPEPINWYRTAFHEIGHWTGAKHRLDRTFGGRFGDHAYAMEELVAEMSAAFTCASLGIVPTVRHADYLASWVAVLKSDKRAVVQAASKASKASDYILDCSAEMKAAA